MGGLNGKEKNERTSRRESTVCFLGAGNAAFFAKGMVGETDTGEDELVIVEPACWSVGRLIDRAGPADFKPRRSCSVGLDDIASGCSGRGGKGELEVATEAASSPVDCCRWTMMRVTMVMTAMMVVVVVRKSSRGFSCGPAKDARQTRTTHRAGQKPVVDIHLGEPGWLGGAGPGAGMGPSLEPNGDRREVSPGNRERR